MRKVERFKNPAIYILVTSGKNPLSKDHQLQEKIPLRSGVFGTFFALDFFFCYHQITFGDDHCWVLLSFSKKELVGKGWVYIYGDGPLAGGSQEDQRSGF